MGVSVKDEVGHGSSEQSDEEGWRMRKMRERGWENRLERQESEGRGAYRERSPLEEEDDRGRRG